jgi:hypothetical protein
MIDRNDIGDENSQSLTLPEAVDEQHVKSSRAPMRGYRHIGRQTHWHPVIQCGKP